MIKAAAAIGLLAVLSALAAGSAASLNLSGGSLGSGTGTVVACGNTAAATVSYSIDGLGNVTGANVSGLPATCNGAQARITLTVGTVAGATAGPATVSGGSATLPLLTPLLAATASGLTGSQVTLQGP